MSREIKFRVWDTKAKKWCGYDDTGHVIDLHHSIRHNCFMVDNDAYDFPKDLELSQYSGLKDKNGKDIYERDIVRSEDGFVFSIEWENASPGYWMPNDYDDESRYAIGVAELEVIGNIYENPELLEEK
jgi:uncharacterized phage protein (TIGR01671 family)